MHEIRNRAIERQRKMKLVTSNALLFLFSAGFSRNMLFAIISKCAAAKSSVKYADPVASTAHRAPEAKYLTAYGWLCAPCTWASTATAPPPFSKKIPLSAWIANVPTDVINALFVSSCCLYCSSFPWKLSSASLSCSIDSSLPELLLTLIPCTPSGINDWLQIYAMVVAAPPLPPAPAPCYPPG